MSNRAQRRAIARISKARKPGQSFAEAIGSKQMVERAVRQQAHDTGVMIEADIMNQRFLWESIVALNEVYGYAGVRAVRYMEGVDNVVKEVAEMAAKHGEEYAFEKLRQRASQITGMEIRYIHEAEMLAARKENEANGVFFDPDPDL